MGIFSRGNCNSCDVSLNILSLYEKCDFCEKRNCEDCIHKINFSDYYGYLKFFESKIKTFKIPPPYFQGRKAYDGDRLIIIGIDTDYKYDCNMCSKCYKYFNIDNFKIKYKEALNKANDIAVIMGNSTKLNTTKSGYYKRSVIGSKLDLIELFKICAAFDGYDYIFEIIVGFHNGVCTGTCKSGKS